MNRSLEESGLQQKFANDYQIVDGIAMREQYGVNFQIPPAVIKRNIQVGQYVEVRIDSTRFSTHQQDAERCSCPSCDGDFSNPILRHTDPDSLVPLPPQDVPSRGWGEDFWVLINERDENWLRGSVDNPLVESRLHGLHQTDEIFFEEKSILAVHGSHRQEMVSQMNEHDLKELVQWLATLRDQS
ncbi:hypothetical protein OAF34_00530 [Pirellulaceae bacterium]|jgi:hypothetical protein|nr:hypothetical protein [Pirellulaceae bacterium]